MCKELKTSGPTVLTILYLSMTEWKGGNRNTDVAPAFNVTGEPNGGSNV
jgi:hypothetical protein